MATVQSLLAEGEGMRVRLKGSLDDCYAEVQRREARIADMEQDRIHSEASQRLLERQVRELETINHQLRLELSDARKG